MARRVRRATFMSSTDLRHLVVVITGASSGIARATALAFARGGARVVAAARNAGALETLALEGAALDGEIVAAPTDVTDPSAVTALAETAVRRFGRIDAWVNAAAVAMYARVEDTEPHELARLLEVNVVGTANGVRAALPVMEEHGGGVIVNIGSVESERALPYQAAYAASKHAVKGLTDALRAELTESGSPVDVVLVKPSSMNTPFFRHARSKLGLMPRPVPPVYEPETVADAIVQAVRHPVREVIVGGGGRGLVLLERVSPALLDRVLGIRAIGRGTQTADRADDGRDNLDAPLDEPGAVHGKWGDEARGRSWYTTLVGLHPERARIAGVLGIGALLLLLRRR
jgi:NAD(P)-dependent dehydrogenase (short-subunit alcohol dehydrogenase family)